MPPLPDIKTRPQQRLGAVVLGSGSSGNSMALTCGDETILLDAGFSARETIRRLTAAGIDPTRISAVLLSHEHSDHVKGVRVLASRLGIPVYASMGTLRGACLERDLGCTRRVRTGETFRMGSISVTAFGTSHDAAEPMGFRFDSTCGSALGVLTDSGAVTAEALEVLRGCDMLAIESNHDETMLESGPYPAFLKRRIGSARGHLSNHTAAASITALASDRLQTVICLHLSQTNNTPRLAEEAVSSALSRLDHAAVVVCATQDALCILPDMTAS